MLVALLRTRCVFKCHLRAALLSHSRVTVGNEFQIDGAMTLKAL